MKHIHVACAIIERHGSVLATQRSEAMSMPLKWEFPGGKIHERETPEACIKRELKEELAVEIRVGRSLAPVTHRYPSCVVTLYPFVCTIAAGDVKLLEHKDLRWLAPGRLGELDWAEADIPIMQAYCAAARAGVERSNHP